MSIIKDISLAKQGMERINWVKSYMPVLRALHDRFEKTKPLSGKNLCMSIHLEAKTAYLALVFKAAGANVYATGCNPLSTRDDIAAALVSQGIEVFAVHGVFDEEYMSHLKAALNEGKPHIVIDDGGDLTQLLHGECAGLVKDLYGACEETTTGVHRAKARSGAGKLSFPILNVNDANCKYLFDNRYGTGQSVLDGLLHETNCVLAGKTFIMAGYGWCGRGIAMRAAGLGAHVIVTEINPFRALEAAMDGYRVMTMDAAAELGDIFLTATGCKDVIVERHFRKMKNGVILANAGHFDVEINKAQLSKLAVSQGRRKDFIDGYEMPDGRVINLMSEGRLVNITAGMGHPADIMDMSFALQSLGALYMAENGKNLENRVYDMPAEIDEEVARLKVAAMGLGLDRLSRDQEKYVKQTM